jgi:hypothetical protein
MPAGSSCRLLSSFTCSPHEGGKMHLLLSHSRCRVATEPSSASRIVLLEWWRWLIRA